MLARRRNAFLAACMVPVTACAGGDAAPHLHVIEAHEELGRIAGEYVTAFSVAPDGTMFASTLKSLHRADAPAYDTWVAVADYADIDSRAATAGFEAKELFVPSRDTVFARSFGRIVRWTSDDGLGAFTSDTLQAVLWDMWGKSPTEVYAVGSIGTFLGLDGEGWSLLHNPLLDGPLDSHDSYHLWRITGAADALYLRTGDLLYQLAGGEWSTIEVPADCQQGPLAAREDALLVECPGVGLYELSESRWRLLTTETELPAIASAAPDGAVLLTHMHHFRPSFREVTRDSVILHRHTRADVRGVGAVAAYDSWLFFFRSDDEGSVLLRSRRR